MDNRTKIEITLQIAFFEGEISMLDKFIKYNLQVNEMSKDNIELIINKTYEMINERLLEYKKKKVINFLIMKKFEKFENNTRGLLK